MTLKDLQVIFEDNHLIAVNKPSGALAQKDDTGDGILADVVKQYIKLQYDKPGDVFLGIIHRLDRPTSGAMIFARTSKALERMNKLFAEQRIQKTYYAVSRNRPEPHEGHLEHYLLKDTSKNIVHAFDFQSKRNEGAKLATLDYELVGNLDGYCLIKVTPHTGRQHQIRVQLQQLNCSIVGDLKYGAKEKSPDERAIYLHCGKMEFVHPVKNEPVVITAEFPRDRLWSKIGKLVNFDEVSE
jgi:23S rRNA pseudouridine1911/1915/1917 synthase